MEKLFVHSNDLSEGLTNSGEEAFLCPHDIWEVHLLHTDVDRAFNYAEGAGYPLHGLCFGVFSAPVLSIIQTEQVVSMGSRNPREARSFSDC